MKVDRKRGRGPRIALLPVLFLSALSVTGEVMAERIIPERVLFEKLFPSQNVMDESGRSIDLDVEFELGSAELAMIARAQLDVLGQVLTSPEAQGAKIGIYGHTDASGSRGFNLRLSRERAAVVKKYLVERFGIDAGRLKSKGYGPDRLKFPDRPLDGANRRVEVVNLTPLVPPETQPAANEGRREAERSGKGQEAGVDLLK